MATAKQDWGMLLNWPPSRGPQPAWMRARPRYDAPTPTVAARRAPRRHKGPGARAGDYRLFHHVDSVASLTLDQARHVVQGLRDGRLADELPVRTLVLDMGFEHYLVEDKVARVTIRPYRQWIHRGGRWSRPRMDLGYVLWQIARVYRRLYRAHRRWGIWGHALDDLTFEGLKVRDGRLFVEIGS